jgi:hypothetical protein
MFPGGDPFHKPGRGGHLHNKDYAKFVQWTPLKMAIAIIFIALPYIGIVIAIASALSIKAVLPLILLPIALGVLVGLAYGIGLLGRAKPQHKRTSRRRR